MNAKKNPQKASVVLLLGEDTLQRVNTIKSITKDHFGKDEAERVDLDADQSGINTILEEVQSFSLLSTNKLVVVNNAHKIKKTDADKLARYAANPGAEVPLILMAPNKKEVSTILIKALPNEQIIELKKTSGTQIKDMARKRLAKNQVQMTPDALEFFMLSCGDDAETAMRELEKILLWAEEGQMVNLEECQRLVQAETEQEVWDMTNAVAAKDAKKAIACLGKLIHQGGNAIQLTALLASMFRKLYQVKALENQKLSPSDISKKAGMPKWMLDRYRQQARGFSLDEIQTGLLLIRQADDDLKGGKPASLDSLKWMTMERLIIDLCHVKQMKQVI